MTKLLHITASPRGERSRSRRLGRELVAAWLDAHPGDTVTERDVGRNPPPHVTEAWVAGAFSPPDTHTDEMRAALRPSDELVDELLAHDVVVVSTPMYNFNVPSGLKAYIDQIIRPGVTFGYDRAKSPPQTPLVVGKRLVLVTARGGGGYGPGEPAESMNFETPYLKAAFGWIGLTDVACVHLDSVGPADSPPEEAVARPGGDPAGCRRKVTPGPRRAACGR